LQGEIGEGGRKQREAVRDVGQFPHIEMELSQVGQAVDALVELIGWVARVGLNTQVLKMRASFGKGAEEEEEEDGGGHIPTGNPFRL
jgi:hypothetical protein